MKAFFVFLLLGFFTITAMAQHIIKYDDVRSFGWNKEVKVVEIRSSGDGSLQKAYFYASADGRRQPLTVSLHTWSGDYTQNDPLVKQCLLNDWNYIHPDFRGPNWTAPACGSPLVLSDIDDAIQYAIDHGNVNPDEIHVIGVSGGGYATLMAFLNTRHKVKSFNAWAPISDLERWYYESAGRGNNYAKHILKCTSSENGKLDVKEARKRSPMYMEIPENAANRGKLYIYEGIHDGYTGSVPVTQSFIFYNRMVRALGGGKKDVVSKGDMLKMVTMQLYIPDQHEGYIADRRIHYKRNFKNLQLLIFEGGHEMLPAVAFDYINCCGVPKHNKVLLTIGDSNGAAKDGWVNQLREIRSQDVIFNVSVSGNTLGFDNNGNEKLNTLRNIDRYLLETTGKTGGKPIDVILINLGTNDCKAVFSGRREEVPENLEKLILAIRAFHFPDQAGAPEIRIISPPPYGPDSMLKAKYHGGDACVRKQIPVFEKIAAKYGCPFLNIYDILKDDYAKLSPDGVHMSAEGQKIIAAAIDRWMQ